MSIPSMYVIMYASKENGVHTFFSVTNNRNKTTILDGYFLLFFSCYLGAVSVVKFVPNPAPLFPCLFPLPPSLSPPPLPRSPSPPCLTPDLEQDVADGVAAVDVLQAVEPQHHQVVGEAQVGQVQQGHRGAARLSAVQVTAPGRTAVKLSHQTDSSVTMLPLRFFVECGNSVIIHYVKGVQILIQWPYDTRT